ncbi:hypothetical protein [Limnofasciculus baicalensis]|uniref:vWA-MoxR associated protein N-terminal HTH domain-containing protein n=1 Tax=Limnofasciculus baicalensis BBK-W-15 TaxID=2699891 RepID=A0AAE3KUG1_9CYAN|nr:hypothetical protein [Limnofasciculus baicalensis]MCP2731477.1 hypothetical protein [Limnofasciculus baicalensis BBK-W-15]
MDSPQILQFVDEAVCAKTGKHLNNLQRRIIGGILNRQKYADVAETYGYSAKHVKKSSHELLQMLSEVFGEVVKKSNLESVLERQINHNINLGNNNTFKDSNKISYINNCSNPSTPTPDESQPETPDLQEESKNQANIEIIYKLRQFGLSDEQIAEALHLPLEQLQQVDGGVNLLCPQDLHPSQ